MPTIEAAYEGLTEKLALMQGQSFYTAASPNAAPTIPDEPPSSESILSVFRTAGNSPRGNGI